MEQGNSRIEIRKILKQLESLPTLPNIVYELNRVVNNPMSSATDVGEIMEKDQSLAAKVLKTVNSAYYGIPGGIADLNRAISYLGFDAINQIVLTATVFQTLNKKTTAKFDLSEFWKHALGVAMAAETISKWAKFRSPQECFSCGLLHDLGKVALYQVAPNILDEIVEKAGADNISFLAAETKMNIVPHTHIGAILAQMWKLPPLIEMSALYHHEDGLKKRNIIKAEVNLVVDIINLSNGILHQLNFGNSGYSQKTETSDELLKRVKLSSVQLPLILKDIERQLATVEDFIKIIS